MSRVPILVILGATGTGKSKLAIELARKFCGEIISADSMQVYKGLDVITAKVTSEEQAMAPHHMLDCIDPLSNFTVVDFRNRALPIIDELLARKKLPIIVGGTNYYIESLLWQVLVEEPPDNGPGPPTRSLLVFDRDAGFVRLASSGTVKRDATTEDDSPAEKRMKNDVDEPTNEELHRRLKEVDPRMASRLHPNNRRKVIRSLQVFEQTGKKHSDILADQRLAIGGSGLGGPLRYDNSIIFWLQCDQEVLDKRLDERVDKMLSGGLIRELVDFHARYNEDRLKANALPDYTKGIFQTIGFKEFHEYLILPQDEKETEKAATLLSQGIENLKLHTRRYARRQRRWVLNRFIRRADRQVPDVYPLDCTDLDEWNRNVFEPAATIVGQILDGEKPNRRSLNEEKDGGKASADYSHEEGYYCETCERVLIGQVQWEAHVNGRKHQRVLKQKQIAENADKDCDAPQGLEERGGDRKDEQGEISQVEKAN